MSFLTHDVRQAFRALRRNPGFTAAAACTLALGIGAATVIFSAVHGLLLAPLPFPDSGRLLSLWEKNPERGWYQNWVARANYLDWREQCRAFASMAAYWEEPETAVVTGSGEPAAVRAHAHPRACSRSSASPRPWAALWSTRRTGPRRSGSSSSPMGSGGAASVPIRASSAGPCS